MHSVRAPRRDLPQLELLVAVADLIKTLFSLFSGEPPAPRITYEEAVGWFWDHRPRDERAVKAALYRQPEHRGTRLYWIFMDADNGIIEEVDGKPCGRMLLVQELDAELQALFGDTNLVVFE